MRVLKVVAEGLTTSFRYPHFMQGIHPTFEMPPPATIYGHICSALGEWISPLGLHFAYHFTYEAQFDDMEHVHVLEPGTGRIKGTSISKVLEGNVNPFKRSLLFKPRLTLYINKPEWESAFKSPYYTVVLGRSQDLFTYTNVSVLDLKLTDRAYFEHTLAPYRLVLNAARGIVVLMPRYLDYTNKRAPTFARYLIIRNRIYSDDFIHYETDADGNSYWVDPTSPVDKGAHLGLMFHTFVEELNG